MRLSLPRILLVALLLRVLYVVSMCDVFFYAEELEKGTAAKAMIDGIGLPHYQLAYHYYEGGGFVVSHLKALAFLLVGENLLAHKLVALGFILAVLAAGYTLVRRIAGTGAANWFGILFTLGPAAFQKLGLINVGIHSEACLFVLIALNLILRLAFEEQTPRRVWFLLGLTVGFGIYFSYQVAVVGVFGLLVLARTRWRSLLREGGVLGLAGTLVGGAPLIVMAALVGNAVLDIHGNELVEFSIVNPRLGEFLGAVLLDGAFGNVVEAWAWLLAITAAVLFLVFGPAPNHLGARKQLRALALYLLLFLLAFGMGNFVPNKTADFFQANRLAPAWMTGTVFVAVAVSRAFASATPRVALVGRVAGIAMLVLGVWSTVDVVAGGRPDRIARNWTLLTKSKGYAYGQYFRKIRGHIDGDEAALLSVFMRFEEPSQEWLRDVAAAGISGGDYPDPSTALAASQAIFARVDPENAELFETGLGTLILRTCRWDVARAIEWARKLPAGTRERLLDAIGRVGSGSTPRLTSIVQEIALARQLSAPESYVIGLGYRIAFNADVRRDPDVGEAFIAGYPEAAAQYLREGCRRGRAFQLLP